MDKRQRKTKNMKKGKKPGKGSKNYIDVNSRQALKEMIRCFMVKGYTNERMREEIESEVRKEEGMEEFKLSRNIIDTISAEIRRDNIKAIKGIAKKFNLQEFIAERRMKFDWLMEKACDVAEHADKDQARVGAINMAKELLLEDERLLNRLGIETSKVDEEGLRKSPTVVFVKE